MCNLFVDKRVAEMAPLLIVELCLLVAVFGQRQTFEPISFTLPFRPVLDGALSPNYALYNAERLHQNKIAGPTSFAFLNGNVYTLTADRKIVNIATCVPKVVANLSPPGCSSPAQCGVLMDIKVDNNGLLVVVDAYRGVFRVNPLTGAVEQLYASTTPVGGRAPRFLNGLVLTPDGAIVLSDSSDKYDAANDVYALMEGRPSGRILVLNPTTKVITELVKDGLAYPNGLEVTPDGTQLLVAETGRARIVSISLAPATFRQQTMFSENLPGVPGNIRRSARGTYWVGLSFVRHAGVPSSMDTYSNNPSARQRTVYSVDQNTIRSYYLRYGMIVELDATGKPIGSLHDPTGMVINSISEAAENEGLLYITSPSVPYVLRIVLPQGDNRVVTIDSVIQVLRSRCQIPEDKLAQAKAVLIQYISQQTGNSTTPATPPTSVTTAAPTITV